ncbi:MAG: uracil-DNA glycosylase [Tissierellia bacterium]|nr:uracil-DNA glycosylase [Tissierellia bacterium]
MLLKKERIDILNRKLKERYPDKGIVLGSGDLDSPIMLIGEAPGSKEVELGKPFVGQAGKHLDEFLEILNIRKDDIYITNSVKFRPTKTNPKTGRLSNRPPTIKEIDDFRDLIYEEVDIIQPKIIVTLGNTSLKSIFNDNTKIGDVHGKLLSVEIRSKEYKVFPLYHPAAVIYNRSLKDVYISDLESLKKEIEKIKKTY